MRVAATALVSTSLPIRASAARPAAGAAEPRAAASQLPVETVLQGELLERAGGDTSASQAGGSSPLERHLAMRRARRAHAPAPVQSVDARLAVDRYRANLPSAAPATAAIDLVA